MRNVIIWHNLSKMRFQLVCIELYLALYMYTSLVLHIMKYCYRNLHTCAALLAYNEEHKDIPIPNSHSPIHVPQSTFLIPIPHSPFPFPSCHSWRYSGLRVSCPSCTLHTAINQEIAALEGWTLTCLTSSEFT